MHPKSSTRSIPDIFILKIGMIFLICYLPHIAKTQTYYGTGFTSLYTIELGESACSCGFNLIGPITPTNFHANGLTFTPDTNLVMQGGAQLAELDTLTGDSQIFFTPPAGSDQSLASVVSVGGGIFYGMTHNNDDLYRFNTNSGSYTLMGSTGFNEKGDLTLFNGNIYYATYTGIVLLDTTNLANSSIIVNFPPAYTVTGLTASHICNSLLAAGGHSNPEWQLILINIIDGSITVVCDIPDNVELITYISSLLEFADLSDCEITLDLDCNDSSGAQGADYNSADYNCLSDGVGINDEDTRMSYDAIITSMTVQVAGFVPDAPNEMVVSTGSTPNIDVAGSGTDMITLTNEGGAKSTDFIDALRLIRYKNTAVPLTPGPRTVEVQFTTESGTQSNVAIAFVEVLSLPVVEVDLGPDALACDGETETFDAGNPGAIYSWSTGSHNQNITVDESGEYIVTVSDGINCPNADTVELEIIPIVHVALSGDTEICDNEPANLIINTDTPFSLDVDISSDPGSPFNFPDVDGDFSFTDLIAQTTTYTITNVTSSQDACITITDPVHVIDVYPTYNFAVDAVLCDGDSIWLGFGWEHEAGVYENTLNTFFGCDSVVTTMITVLPAFQIANQSTTCDSASAGVFVTFLNNPNGCDTVITTTVTLLPSDTTAINLFSCNQSNVGIVTQSLVNQLGCDSLIITTTNYIPPVDTTSLFQTTCDSSLLGSTQQLLLGSDGCDSLIITTISIAPTDTTYYNGVSCDPASIGVTQTLYNNISGCDSLVINTIIAGTPDTTYLFSTSCDPASLGVFESHFVTSALCDSTVILTVTFSAQDSTFLTSSSCDPNVVGVFVQQLVNQFGCDSIVTETISLLPTDESFITSTTCDPTAAGTFDHVLTNQFGCDSIVHETISLLPNSSTTLSASTCASAEAGVFVTTLQNQFGCDSVITLTVSLIPADTTQFNFNTCDPNQVGNIQNTFTNQDGCDSLVITSTSLFPLPQLNLIVTSDFNGYGIRCFGEHDGSLQAELTGEDPFEYTWSTGDTTQSITGLGAGDYSVLITDTNGCETSDAISLIEPPEFSIGFEVSQPDCFNNETGSITVVQTGGVSPIRYSIDGINYQPSPIFNSLSAGSYTITALDANDCETKEIILINVAVDIHVDLGQDRITMPGDTSMIEALVNVPYDSLSTITWTGLINPPCPTCLTQLVSPIITTAYTLTVSNAHGCSDKDSVIIYIQNVFDIYVPNVFSPNDDGINDRLIISAGAQVEEIESFSVFDRWGNMVFFNEHFLPGDLDEAWDGLYRGKAMNPAVYAYKMIARFSDQRLEVRYGDVTLITND